MAPTKPWLLLLCLASASAGSCLLQARAQTDSQGFISIDCGLPGKTSYIDDTTGLSYVPDAGFIDTGTNHNISVEWLKSQPPSQMDGVSIVDLGSADLDASSTTLSKRYLNVRSFPNGVRNCYTLRSLVSGLKYLLRATFFYGNYDGLNRTPIFDLHIGVNFWKVVNISKSSGNVVLVEAIVMVPDDFVQVCLINTGTGMPFISGLDLRPLKQTIYPQTSATEGLVLVARLNFGIADSTYVRYPDDPHDRFWTPYVNTRMWTNISTTSMVENINNVLFEVPTVVMQTAIRSRDVAHDIEFFWDPEPEPNDPSPGYIVIMHFSELQILPNNAVRQVNVFLNDMPWSGSGFIPHYLHSGAVYNNNPMRYSHYNLSISATATSTLPPIINALEIFSVISTTNLSTDSQDVSAISAIKVKYQLQNNWMGDPCVPMAMNMSWDQLSCSYVIASPRRIKSLDLSFSGLAGDISSSFANLKAIQYLNLSNNKLTGSIPEDLSQLPSLTTIDLSGNLLSGSIPYGLLQRVQDGSLNLRYYNNPDLCTSGHSCKIAKTNSKLAIYIVAIVVVVVVILSLALLLFCLLRRRKRGSMSSSGKPQKESCIPANDGNAESSLSLENRRFTYDELGMITNGFQRVLGQGGFGCVYDGFLEDGTHVAVKLRTRSSSQGVSVFLAEAQILTRIHHKNLVSMIGYCKDGEDMALVYEYMSEGTLQEHITGTGENGKYLLWRQRLRIALDSARGLEYLHKGCNPPLVHRDVKSTNILLNTRLEAKIADFGMSKAFNHDDDTHISTNTLVGTPGYVDPECLATMQPTTKSDVYSFGVVLLELVTGKPAILQESTPISITQWARLRLARGNIESVVDKRMRGDYEVNGVWKVADIALKCTGHVSVQRPTITDVVVQLQECLELEDCRSSGNMNNGFYNGSCGNKPNLSYDAYQSTDVSPESASFEMEHDPRRMPTVTTGPIAR